MPFKLDGIDHVEVFVRDIEASIRWYADVLGLKARALGSAAGDDRQG